MPSGNTRARLEISTLLGNQASAGDWGNRLLDALPEETILLLKPYISLVMMRQGQMCVDAGQLVDHVYFPKTGLIALAISTERGESYTSVIGRYGAVVCRGRLESGAH